MRYSPEDGKWHAKPKSDVLQAVREQLSAEQYERQKRSLKEFLCSYFSAENGCDSRQGKSISPVGATPKGGKILKVRWGLPGCGKSGGLRLVVVAYCDELRVYLAEAFNRKDDPSTAEVLDAADGSD